MSDRLRASMTCEQAGLGTVAQIDTNLAEWDYGDYEGLSTAEIRLFRPDWNIWEDGCSGGEMPAAVTRRADQSITRLDDLEGKLLLFSHGQFERLLAARWIGLRAVEGQHFAIAPTSISILSIETDHPPRRVISRCGTRKQSPLQMPNKALPSSEKNRCMQTP
jgi:broad specificity phosphatase PhoE